MDFPFGGVDLSMEFNRQRPGTSVFGLNVRLLDPLALRDRGASRAGLERYLPEQVTGNATTIQHINFIVDPQGAALISDQDEEGQEEFDSNQRYRNDPSTSNRRRRIPVGVIRRVRRRGSGRQPNRKFPKKRPIINWPTPGDIIVGTPLTGIQLNASADVAGSFVYTPSFGKVLAEGRQQQLKAIFTPVDGAYYPATVFNKINVVKTPFPPYPGNVQSVSYFCTLLAFNGPGTDMDCNVYRAIVPNVGGIVTDGPVFYPAMARLIDPGVVGTTNVPCRPQTNDQFDPGTPYGYQYTSS